MDLHSSNPCCTRINYIFVSPLILKDVLKISLTEVRRIYNKIHTFKSVMNFDKFVYLCNHHPNQNIQNVFIAPENCFIPFYNQTFSSSLPQATVDLIYLRSIVSFACCSCSVAQSCPTLCSPINCSIPGSLSFTISRSLLRFLSTELVMLSNHLILCRPLLLLPSVLPSESRSVMSSLNSPGQNTGVGSSSFLQGIFPTQGSNPGLPHYRRILYQLSHKGSPVVTSIRVFSSESPLRIRWQKYQSLFLHQSFQ